MSRLQQRMKQCIWAGVVLSLVGCESYQEGGDTMDDSGETITSIDDMSTSGIQSVWRNVGEGCPDSPMASLEPDPNEPFVVGSGMVSLPDVGASFEVTSANGQAAVVKLWSDDSRGLQDHYILLSAGAQEPTYGAVVVTEVPASYTNPDKLFPVIRKMQNENAGGSVEDFATVIETPTGPVMEILVPRRTSSECFPTAPYVSGGAGKLTISRYMLSGDKMVELSLVVDVDPEAEPEEKMMMAREAMDAFEELDGS